MNESEFKTKVLPVSPALMKMATHFLKNEDEARDVVQDVFLKLWQKRATLNEIEHMEAFAMRMTKNRCLDVLRAKKMVPIDAETSRFFGQETIDVHSQTVLSEAAGQVKILIDKLPELQQKVMHMRDIEQLEYDEIAGLTGLQVNAIRVNLSRARKKVRDEFLKLNSDGYEKGKRIAATLF